MKIAILHQSRTFLKYSCLLSLCAAGFCISVQAQDYLGANAVLRQAEERNAKPGEKPAKPDAASQLRVDLKAFSEVATNLPPAESAKRWLELVDRAAKIRQQSMRDYDSNITPLGPDDLLGALPPPAAWNELAKAIAARPTPKSGGEIRETGLHLLGATLTGDAEARQREITNLQNRAQSANARTAYYYRNILNQISEAQLAFSNDPNAILKSLERQLAFSGQRGGQNLNVPNLVSQVGAEKAEAFLRKALVSPNATINFRSANETSRLAQKLALELIDQLKTPQWGLVNSLDSVAIYEALDKRFGNQTNSTVVAAPGLPSDGEIDFSTDNFSGGNQKSLAQVYYFLGLISKDRTKDAVTIAKKLGGQENEYVFGEAFREMERAGYTAALDNFLYELLSQDPTLQFWNQYVEIAAKAGETDRMLTLVRAALARDNLSDAKKVSLHVILFKALLASDAVDEGVAEIRRLMASDNSSSEIGHQDYDPGQLGVMLARLGILLQKPEWTEEGIAASRKWLADAKSSRWQTEFVRTSLAKILFETKRGPQAEALLIDALANATRKDKSQSDYSWNGGEARSVLASLACLYHQAGRFSDILTLLEQSPDWNAKDVSELFETSCGGEGISMMSLHTGSSDLPVPYLTANALLAIEKKERAAKITDALLQNAPGLDRGYELLLALEGTNAIPRLDGLFARDQFEERPLIWKAHLLRQQNHLEEAEKIVRQAVAIDPSDGEQGRGDRMRVYAELADIREARGDKKEADFYREVVKAIRLSEDADQFYMAGLLKRAIGMYEEALKHFSDAYCIQSRLAIQLSALGLNEEAEAHYRRAFELMPDSFGRVESHCFGCERAFDGERAQSIAEKVFTKFAAEHPNKPQVHYLLGYLREEEERFNEAGTNYLAATRLDPDYLNAWVKLQGVSENILMPIKERDDIAFNILRLDPLHRHASPRFDRISDLAGLWNAMTVAANRQPSPPSDLFPLPASRIALEKKESTSDNPSMRYRMMQQQEQERESLSPARAVAQTLFVRLAGQLILGDYGLVE